MRKELREIMPWILFAAIAFLAIGFLILTMEEPKTNYRWRFSDIKPGTEVQLNNLLKYSILTINGAWLFVISLALGLALGIRQFWITFFTKTWAFEFHRSVNRRTILIAKLSAACIAFILALGTVWTFLFIYASRPEYFMVPPSLRNYLEGWIFITLGFLAYLATALTALTKARWYTTKIVPLGFAFLILLCTLLQPNPSWSIITLIIGIVILLSQVTYTFLNREF